MDLQSQSAGVGGRLRDFLKGVISFLSRPEFGVFSRIDLDQIHPRSLTGIDLMNIGIDEDTDADSRLFQFPDVFDEMCFVGRDVQPPFGCQFFRTFGNKGDNFGLDVESDGGRQLILDGIDMIRSYADRYHHAKEEDILFKYFDENSQILQVMYEDHTTGREHVKAMLEALERKDKNSLGKHLMAYRELLTEHIKKEDEILYPWMDRNLSTTQIGELFSKFNEVDEQMGFSPEKYETFIDNLEKKLNA